MKENQKEIIIQNDIYCLTVNAQSQRCVIIELVSNKKDEEQHFQTKITLGETSENENKINNYFDTVQTLVEYLKIPENIQILIEEKQVKVLLMSRHPTKKDEYLQICKLILFQKFQEKPEKNKDLAYILNFCTKQQNQLVNKNNKQFLTIIVNSLIQLNARNEQMENQNNNNLQRMILKMQNLSNNMQKIEAKIVNLYEKDEQKQTQTKLKQLFKQNIQKQSQKYELYNLKIKQQIEAQREVVSNIFQNIKNETDKNQKHFEQIQTTLKQHHHILLGISQDEGWVIGEKSQKPIVYQKQSKIEQQNKTNFVDTSAKYSKHFKVKNNKITKQQDFIFPTMLVGSRPLREHNDFTIKIKKMGILQNVYPGVCFGIVDARCKHKQTCQDGDNVIEYQCSGKLYDKNKFIREQGKGFKAGSEVRVQVNFDEGNIIWEVDGDLACVYESPSIKDRTIEWRPYVFMRDKGDQVKWIK